jgi:hypothetical protein
MQIRQTLTVVFSFLYMLQFLSKSVRLQLLVDLYSEMQGLSTNVATMCPSYFACAFYADFKQQIMFSHSSSFRVHTTLTNQAALRPLCSGGILLFAPFYLGTLQFALFYFDLTFFATLYFVN